MTQVTNYQCPNCYAPLRFDGAAGMQVCDSCGTKFEVEVIEQLYADKEQAAAAAGTEPQWDISMTNNFTAEEAAKMRGYLCPSCAAEIVCDDTTAATACPYCGNPTVVPGQFAGGLKPDYVIPFKLDKNKSIAALKSYYGGKKFLPDAFEANNHIEEIKGVYVPFWLYDGETDSVMRFKGTKVTSRTSGDYKITDTDHYRVVREGRVAFEKVPVDGSSKMPDAHMDAIEPFNYVDLKPFSTAYLPGFLADKYDEDAETCSKRANDRITASTERAFANTTSGYTSLNREYSDIKLKKSVVKYSLMPVWMLSTKWDKQNFLFAMNGQTGKLVGDLPIDNGKYWGWFFKIAGVLALILAILLFAGNIAGLASGSDLAGYTTPDNYVTDEVGALTETQIKSLNEKAAALAEKRKCEAYIWIVDLVPEEYAVTIDNMEVYVERFYRSNNFGCGSDKNGMLLILETGDVPGERDYLFYTNGPCKSLFNNSKRETILDEKIVPLFKKAFDNGNFYGVADKFLDEVEKGFSDDIAFSMTMKVGAVILIPIIIAALICSSWKKQMKTAVTARTADNYIPANGFNLTAKEDKFLYRTTTRVKIEKSSSSGGGGSSSSSSGSSSGGKV